MTFEFSEDPFHDEAFLLDLLLSSACASVCNSFSCSADNFLELIIREFRQIEVHRLRGVETKISRSPIHDAKDAIDRLEIACSCLRPAPHHHNVKARELKIKDLLCRLSDDGFDGRPNALPCHAAIGHAESGCDLIVRCSGLPHLECFALTQCDFRGSDVSFGRVSHYNQWMRALSVKQPWASLIASGAKSIEVRTWKTSYRGTLTICSSRQRSNWPVATVSGPSGPLGVTVCEVDLVDVRPIALDDASFACIDSPEGFAWVLANPRVVEPRAVKGQLGIFYLRLETE